MARTGNLTAWRMPFPWQIDFMEDDDSTILGRELVFSQTGKPAEVLEIGNDTHPAQMMVKLRLADTADGVLLARVTRRSAEALALCPRQKVFAQVKAVALIA